MKMTREEEIEKEVIENILQWPVEKVYATFGPWLETVVNQQKELLLLKLKYIWRNRNFFSFKDTGEQFDDDSMLIFFDPKKYKTYSLSELECILEKIENETLHEITQIMN